MRKVMIVCLGLLACCFIAIASQLSEQEKTVILARTDATAIKEHIHSLEAEILAAQRRGENTEALHATLEELWSKIPEERTNAALDEGGEDCATALAIPSIPYCDTGNTCDNLNDYICSTGAAPAAFGPDVVYTYMPTITTVATFLLCGSLYNTALHIWMGCPTPNSNPICCNDDFCSFQSCCTVLLVPGVTYYIIVDGPAATDCGDYVLNVTLDVSCLESPCDDPCPYPNADLEDINDECATVLCTQGIHCDDTLCGEIRPEGDEDWYCIQIPGPECVRLILDVFGNDTPGWWTTGRGLDPRVSIYGADCSTLIAFDDDGGEGFDSRLISPCLAPGIYLIMVDGFPYAAGSSTGPYILATACEPCPCPDDCVPDYVNTLPFWWEGEHLLQGSTIEAENDCALRPSNDEIWEIHVTRPCLYSFDMCEFAPNGGCFWDSHLFLMTECCGGAEVAHNDDACEGLGGICFGQSSIPCTFLDVGVYYLIVEGFFPVSAGDYVINVECCQPSFCRQLPYDGWDHGDLPPCNYPTLVGNPAHALSNVAWLGPCITPEPAPLPPNVDACDDGIRYWNLPWTPCEVESVSVLVMAGPYYNPWVQECCGCLFLNGWKDGNLDGDFCDTLCWRTDLPGAPYADEWIVQDVVVVPGVWTFNFLDPGLPDGHPEFPGAYPGVFRWRLTSQPVGREGFGLFDASTCGPPVCGTYASDLVGEVEDYIIEDAQLFVELAGFEAIPGDESVALRWTTASESENDYFEVLRDGAVMAQIDGAGNSTTETHYEWIDRELANGRSYEYALVSVDIAGAREELGVRSATPSTSSAVITEFALHQNYPNPFNPATTITYDVPEAGIVSLRVYNLLGQEVAVLVNGYMISGRHNVTLNAGELAAGVYLYRMEAGSFVANRKMILLK